MDSNKNFKKTYKDFISSSQFVVVLLLTLTQSVIIGYFQIYIKGETYNDQQSLQVGLFSLLVTLIFSAVLKAYCSFYMGKALGLLDDDNLSDFVKRTFADWAVVEVRAQIRVLIGLCLFIVPGVIEALRLALATPMVFYDKRMKDKTFDPVLESREILHIKNPVLWTLFSIVILAPVLLHLALQNGEVSFFENSKTILSGVFTAVVFSLFSSFTFLYFAFLYKDAVPNTETTTGEQ